MYSVTHRRCFRRHGCPCKDLWRWLRCHEKCDCHTVASRTWSGLSQSADCQKERSRVSSGLHSCQVEDEDEVVQVQDEYFHLVEFHSSSLFFRVFCLLDSSILFSPAFDFSGDLPRWVLKGIPRMVTKMGICQDRSIVRIQKSLFWNSKTRLDWRTS